MVKVSQLLGAKGSDVYSVTSDVTVYDALKLMGEKNIGALPIIENGELKGIVSERDYARKVILQGKSSKSTPVSDIMTANVITVTLNNSIEDCMELMSNRRIRHLPVVDEGRVVGLLSVSDIVKIIIQNQKEVIDNLHNYITMT
jgi:CBS domain-containing protein